jgi:peptidoglycan/LPS O-acetylase OafA/YrhL
MFLHQATVLSGSPSWLTQYYLFPAHFGQAVYQAVYGVWLGNSTIFSSYNSVLWTMHFELFGSFLIFMFLALFGKLNNRWVFYGVSALFFLKTYYLCFIAGIVISDICIAWPDAMDRLSEKLVWFSLPIGLVLGTWTVSSVYTSVYSHINIPFFTGPQLELFAHMVGAIIVVLAVLKLNLLSRIFETRPFQYLGKISFSLYLIHFLIMSSLSSYVFIRILPVYGNRLAGLSAVLIGLPVTFLAASLYTKWIDIPSIAISKSLGNILLNGKLPQKAWKRHFLTGLRIINPLKKIVAEEVVVE